MAILENSGNRCAELKLALQATLQSRSCGLAANHCNPIYSAAMRAYGTVRPNDAFKAFIGRCFAMEMGFGKDADDRRPINGSILPTKHRVRQVYNSQS